MYIQVKLLNGFSQPLVYQIPSEWDKNIIGKIVKVPLQNRTELAIVEKNLTDYNITKNNFDIKTAISIESLPDDQHYNKFIQELSNYYQIDKLYFLKRIHHFIVEKENLDEPITSLSQDNFIENKQIVLTQEQKNIVDFLIPFIKNSEYKPTLLHGVTGSGKTEVYKKLIEEAIAQNKAAMLILPEVTLAMQFERLLKAQLKNIKIFSFHSGTSIKNKKELWQNLLNNNPVLIIGVHLPILLPIANLGIIIIDEEHEAGFQEKKHPKINTKEAALIRAKLNNIPILLGSATPSISSLYNTHNKNWEFFELRKRFAGSFPEVKVVELNNKIKRESFWISRELEQEIRIKLEKKEQVIIFLNRRGYSFFVQCKECSFIFKCDNCSVSLTLHDTGLLNCHYCGLTAQNPTTCAKCKANKDSLIKKGIGTQQVAQILQKIFPNNIIARADLDVTSKKKAWQKTIEDFSTGKIDILVGTQTITKGYHFANVTLVGILWADLNLNFPIYNATEITLQQIIQVAGRAGREIKPGKVIIQTIGQQTIFDYINEIDYIKFYDYELQNRISAKYPPFYRFAEIEIKHADELEVNLDAKYLFNLLNKSTELNKLNVIILGPAKPSVHKIKNSYMQKIYLKSESFADIIKLFKSINKKEFKSSVFFTPNPLS